MFGGLTLSKMSKSFNKGAPPLAAPCRLLFPRTLDIKILCSMLLSCIVYFDVLCAGSINLSTLKSVRIAGQKILVYINGLFEVGFLTSN